MTKLTKRLTEAFDLARELHTEQKRKQTEIPYLAHLIGVCSLVLEAGGDEDQAIAALLHDAPEDQGGRATLERIRRQFGSRVAEMDEACTDTFEDPKPAWKPRKETYLAHLAEAPKAALLVSLADKVHNARSIQRDHAVIGEAVWGRFKPGREGTVWYYRELAKRFAVLLPGPLADELQALAEHLARLP